MASTPTGVPSRHSSRTRRTNKKNSVRNRQLRIEFLESRLALAAALLEDFSSLRLNGDGNALFAPYLGEDPNQSGSIVNGEYQLNIGAAPSAPYLHFFPRSGGYGFPA